MKTSLFVLCLSVSILAIPAFAQTPPPEQVESVEPMKRSEFTRQQNGLFRKADKNFDGQVTNDEILILAHEINKPKYVAAFKVADTNNNGFISYDEIEARHEEITSQQIARLLNNKENLLKKYDQDGNGTITSKELEEYFDRQSQSKRDQTASNAARDMKFKDADDSGSVSLTEYLDSKASSVIKFANGVQPKAEQILTRDPNGDKTITRLENEAFVTRVFEALDKNKDDELSEAEQSSSIFRQAAKLSNRGLYLTGRQRSVIQSK